MLAYLGTTLMQRTAFTAAALLFLLVLVQSLLFFCVSSDLPIGLVVKVLFSLHSLIGYLESRRKRCRIDSTRQQLGALSNVCCYATPATFKVSCVSLTLNPGETVRRSWPGRPGNELKMLQNQLMSH